MKIMMTGHKGRIGTELASYGVLPLECDVTEPHTIDDSVSKEKPDVIIHLAAISNVNFCEKPETQDLVISVNLRGTYNLLTVAEKYNAQVIMISSDHVFSGGNAWFQKCGPYKETDKPNPVNFYGKSKMAAEALLDAFDNFKVVRTSYLFTKDRLPKDASYPTFIYRSFMYLPHFVSCLAQYAYNIQKMPKLFHVSGSKTVSWYDFMKNIQPDAKKRYKEIDGFAPRPKRAGLKSIHKIFPEYSYLDGIEQMMRDAK